MFILYELKQNIFLQVTESALSKLYSVFVSVQQSTAITALALKRTGAAVEFPVVPVNIKFCFSVLLWSRGGNRDCLHSLTAFGQTWFRQKNKPGELGREAEKDFHNPWGWDCDEER